MSIQEANELIGDIDIVFKKAAEQINDIRSVFLAMPIIEIGDGGEVAFYDAA